MYCKYCNSEYEEGDVCCPKCQNPVENSEILDGNADLDESNGKKSKFNLLANSPLTIARYVIALLLALPSTILTFVSIGKYGFIKTIFFDIPMEQKPYEIIIVLALVSFVFAGLKSVLKIVVCFFKVGWNLFSRLWLLGVIPLGLFAGLICTILGLAACSHLPFIPIIWSWIKYSAKSPE